jgi:hypothetical protein
MTRRWSAKERNGEGSQDQRLTILYVLECQIGHKPSRHTPPAIGQAREGEAKRGTRVWTICNGKGRRWARHVMGVL